MKKINVVLKRWGKTRWLFDDIAQRMQDREDLWPDGCVVYWSEEPAYVADCWLYIRTAEALSSPDPSRTLVQVHDLYFDDYGPGDKRHAATKCAKLSFTHQSQASRLHRDGLITKDQVGMCRPIGALSDFTPRELSDVQPLFNIGWVGRPVRYRGQDIKRLNGVIEAVREFGRNTPCRLTLMGDAFPSSESEIGLPKGVALTVLNRGGLSYAWVDKVCPRVYRGLDVLITFSQSEAGPMCLYEAIASGVPVISSLTGNYQFATMTARSVDDIVSGLRYIHHNRMQFVERSKIIAATMPYRMEDWMRENLALCAGLAK